MKFTLTTLCAVLATASLSQAAWVWGLAQDNTITVGGAPGTGTTIPIASQTNPPTLPGANTSGSFTGTPLYGNVDYNNAVNGSWFDQAPTPVNFTWSTVGGENVEPFWVTPLAPTPSAANNYGTHEPYQYLGFNLDPDGNGTAPDSLTITATFTSGITVRGLNNGAVGLVLEPDIGADVANASLQTLLGDGSPLDYSTVNLSSTLPVSTSPGLANYTLAGSGGGWYGIFDQGLSDTALPHATGNTASQTIGQQTFTMSNFDISGGDTDIRFSFDGGVPADSPMVTIPEPTAFSLLGLGLLGLVTRRKR